MTLVLPGYRINKNAIKRIVDGVEFLSYSVGVMMYVRISVDGRALVRSSSSTYRATIETAGGHEHLSNPKTGKPTRFRTERAAMQAAVKALAKAGGR